jgi:hypothetical protein
MKILENLQLDTWYGIILYVGVLMMAASIFVNIEFLEEKHLFGLGLGLLLIGISYKKAEMYKNRFKPANIHTGGTGFFQWKVIKHNTISIIILVIGLGLTGLFGVLVIMNLL